jgi:hypothetical protein
LLVIGVLGAVLAGVLVVQFSGGQADSTGVSGPPEGPARPVTAARPPAEPAARPAWPKVAAAEASRYDPFALPQAMIQQSRLPPPKAQAEEQQQADRLRQQREQALAALRRRGASTVFRSASGAAAIVGPRVVRVGDELDGFRVVSIDDGGVLLEATGP